MLFSFSFLRYRHTYLRSAADRSLSTKPNTSCRIEMPASLASEGVRAHPGMPFGFLRGSAIATVPGMDNRVAHIGFTPARIEEIRNQLLDPFDSAEINGRGTATSTHQGRNE